MAETATPREVKIRVRDGIEIGTVACFVLARLYLARFRGAGLGRRDYETGRNR